MPEMIESTKKIKAVTMHNDPKIFSSSNNFGNSGSFPIFVESNLAPIAK